MHHCSKVQEVEEEVEEEVEGDVVVEEEVEEEIKEVTEARHQMRLSHLRQGLIFLNLVVEVEGKEEEEEARESFSSTVR